MLAGGLVAASLLGCAAPQPPNVMPTSMARFGLTPLPPRAGCELVRIEYKSLTFLIQPGLPVKAVTARGHALETAWDLGFAPDDEGGLLIRDAAGEAVVRDGEVVAQPERDFARLNGHLVCVSRDRVWVFHEPPP